MSDCTDDCDLSRLCSQRHWSMYWLLIVASMVFVAGRILTLGIETGDVESPFMGANDRSRWATIQSLGDQSTYQIDDVVVKAKGIHRNTIDKVQHVGSDGRLHFYSSKPALLPTALSFLYQAIKTTTGLNLKESPLPVVRLMLLIFNGGCWFLLLWSLASTLERIPTRDWTRYFVVAAAGFATYLSTFAVTLNNHLPAAATTMFLIYCLVNIINRNGATAWYLLAGLTAGFTVSNELPALSLAGLFGLICLYKSWQKCLAGFLPGFAIVIVAFLATNYAAHGDWRPPYAHRGDGPLLGEVAGDFEQDLEEGFVPDELRKVLGKSNFADIREVRKVAWPNRDGLSVLRWKVTDYEGNRVTVVKANETSLYKLHAWDNWYDFEGSYWTAGSKIRSEIDRGQPDSLLYSFHALFGHHGIFLLTPIWVLGFGGMVVLLVQQKFQLRWFAGVAIVVTLVVLGFYVFGVSPMDRNYGGTTCAFRWALWLAPLWLVGMVPIVDWLGIRPSGRALCLALLGISAISALYASENPWVHPWAYEIWESTGLPK